MKTPDPEAVRQLASRPYQKVIRGDEVEGFLAEAPELPGCVTAGASIIEATEMLQDAIEGWIEAALAAGEAIPEPGAMRLTA
ncbi:MAG: type II toxin-antitoxin system HicB family antitoxin [Dehalococcoidia bacterium]|nr:type II toxin-antitoxin system HicB family antitoxin [Dehalococcoidia bacterium]